MADQLQNDSLLHALKLIRTIRDPTPVESSSILHPERELLLKREDVGPMGSFKWRGALCAIARFQAQGAEKIVTASTGNHGAAMAWAAARRNVEAHVVVPEGSNEAKCSMIASEGAHLHFRGSTLDQAVDYAAELARQLDAVFFEDGASIAQLLGTATIGLELHRIPIQSIVVPLACGALAGGLGSAFGSARIRPKIIGVQSSSYARFGAVFREESDPLVPTGVSFADGLADNRIVEPAFSFCRRYVDDVLAVDDAAIRAAVRSLYHDHGIIVEGGAAAPLAAVRRSPERIPGERVALIISGRNLLPSIAQELLGLDLVQ